MDRDEFDEILWEEHDDFEEVTSETIEQQSRWHTYYSKVFKQKSTGKYFEAYWGAGSTEYQDAPSHWSFNEVEPKEVVQTIFVAKKDGIKYDG